MAEFIRVKQVKSRISCTHPQRATLRALGLRRINQQVEQPKTASVMGMVQRVSHLVKVEEIESKS